MSWPRLGLILAALVVAVVPLPSRLVEAWYSRGIYPVLQASITSLSNLVPVALLDLTGLILVAALGFGFWRRVRAAGIVRALTTGVVTLLTLTAVVFLLFVVVWGLNYRRAAARSENRVRPEPCHAGSGPAPGRLRARAKSTACMPRRTGQSPSLPEDRPTDRSRRSRRRLRRRSGCSAVSVWRCPEYRNGLCSNVTFASRRSTA